MLAVTLEADWKSSRVLDLSGSIWRKAEVACILAGSRVRTVKQTFITLTTGKSETNLKYSPTKIVTERGAHLRAELCGKSVEVLVPLDALDCQRHFRHRIPKIRRHIV